MGTIRIGFAPEENTDPNADPARDRLHFVDRRADGFLEDRNRIVDFPGIRFDDILKFGAIFRSTSGLSPRGAILRVEWFPFGPFLTPSSSMR